MKSFKLISLQMITEKQELVDIELVDGLIINKENDSNTWIVEALVEATHYDELKDSLPNEDEEVRIQAVITKQENDPAVFETILKTRKLVDGHISLLFAGHLQNTRSKYAELLLEDLLKKGFTGDELLKEFKEKIRSKRKLATNT
jgi:YwpF-like protein